MGGIMTTPTTSAGYKSAPQQQQQQQKQQQKERESDWSPPSFSNRSRRLSGDLEINPMNPADLAQTHQQQQNLSNFGRRLEEEDFEQIPLNPMFANKANFSNRGGAFSQQNFNRNNTSKYDNW